MTVPQQHTRAAPRLLAAATTLSLFALGAFSPANATPKDPDSADSTTSTSQTSTEMTTTTTTSANREKNREKN